MTQPNSQVDTQMHSFVPIRVIKLGGSLLSLPDLYERFNDWLDAQSPARNVIVTGGGIVVDAIRALDAIHHFSAALTHWVCVDLMSTSARLASDLLGLKNVISTELELRDFLERRPSTSAIACIQPTAYYTPAIAMQRKCPLPESWDCTSDSIAAWLACSIAAEQLVLMKSVDIDFVATSGLSSAEIQSLADCEAVDPVFPTACQAIRNIQFFNLRSMR